MAPFWKSGSSPDKEASSADTMVGKTHDASGKDDQANENGKEASVDGDSAGGRKRTFGSLRDKLKQTHLYDVKVNAIHMKHQIGKVENLFNSGRRIAVRPLEREEEGEGLPIA